MFEISIKGVAKSFTRGAVRIDPLKDVHMTIAKNSITALIGESGCGKTTLMRLIAGLDTPSKGSIEFVNRDQPEQSPKISVVFQEHRLFDWLTVLENVMLSLRHLENKSAREKALEALSLVNLKDVINDYPRELSGGMSQRVAFARAIAGNPDILLLDEAFASLDALNRQRLYREFIEIRKKKPFTVLLITHDMTEAVLLASRIYLLKNGLTTRHFDVDLPYPRTLATEHVNTLSEEILREFIEKTDEKQ